MAEKKLTSIDIESYTVISTGINVLLSIIMSIIIVGLFAVAVPNSIGVMAYLIPTIIFGTMISNIFLAFTEGYLYNTLSSKFGFIKLDIDEEYIKKISTRETALIVGCISLIITLIIYLAFSLIIPLFLSSLMTILMYGSQTNLAAALYQIMFLISNPLFIAIGILGSVIIVTVFTLLATISEKLCNQFQQCGTHVNPFMPIGTETAFSIPASVSDRLSNCPSVITNRPPSEQ